MDSFNYSNSAIIRPPKPDDGSVNNVRHFHVVVDSRDRDVQLYPDPACYVLDMPCDMANVKSVTLMTADVPQVLELNVTSKGNTFLVRDDVTQPSYETIVIEPGFYDSAQLLSALNAKFMSRSIHLTVSFDAITRRFAFTHVTSGKEFDLDMSGRNSLGPILGFAKLFYSSSAGSLTAPFVENLPSPSETRRSNNKYSFLQIDNFGAIMGIGNTASRAFAAIDSTGKYVNVDDMYCKWFNPIMPRLHQLRIKFTDYNGDLVDFQNRDHHFVLRITCLKTNKRF